MDQDGETPAEAVQVGSSCVVSAEHGMEFSLPGSARTDHAGRFVLEDQPRAALALAAHPASSRQGQPATGRVEADRRAGTAAGSADDPVRLRFGFVALHEIVVLDADTGRPPETQTVLVGEGPGDDNIWEVKAHADGRLTAIGWFYDTIRWGTGEPAETTQR